MSEGIQFKQGSNWGKWDLHVHTPESVLSNGFGDDWDTYVQTLFRKALEHEIKAIGITDYYFVSGYKKLKNEYLSNDTKLLELFTEAEIIKIKQILVFPNIEFRINKLIIGRDRDLSWNRKVNFHVLFSDKVSIEDLEEFIGNLKFETTGAGQGPSQKASLTERNLINLGQRLKNEQPEFHGRTDLFVGMVSVGIDDTEIVDLLASDESKFKGNYLLALPCDEDLSQVSWISQGHHPRKLLIQKSHLLFSSNPSTIEFALGGRSSTVEQFEKEFGRLKPCLWGSDAHDFDKLFKPDGDRFTWIKANPTFEGLKQVFYEPEDRVRIQQNIPEDKLAYQVIEKVKYIDRGQAKTFQTDWIYLNENLSTIIGGKSSGKSLLLHHIAKSIDPDQVALKTKLAGASTYSTFIQEHPFDFEVVWKNGTSDLLSQQEKSGSQVTFVPQLYINHLAEENGEKHLTELIDEILKQNAEYKSFAEETSQAIQLYKTIIASAISERLQLLDQYDRLKKEKDLIGAKDKIELEVKRLNDDIEKLRKESGFNSSQESAYKHYNNLISITEKHLLDYSQHTIVLSNYRNFLNAELENATSESAKYVEVVEATTASHEFLNSITVLFKEHTAKLKVEIDNLVNAKIKKLEDLSNRKSRQLQLFRDKIAPLQILVKNQEHLQKLEKELKEQNDKTINIAKFDIELKVIQEKGQQVRDELFANYENLFNAYKKTNDRLKQPEYNRISDEINLEVSLGFDLIKFEAFVSLFDNRRRLNNDFNECFNENNSFLYDESKHMEMIKLISKELSKPTIKLKNEVSIETAFRSLLDDYFKIRYQINYKGDNILDMSPGKRGLVLLQLILHISNSSHPILIDQPEDNLDNRTIYDELRQFIKKRKVKRQIILVTHNANLVVSTDAEIIIVANQAGQQLGKDNTEFTFEYISGALENTFTDPSQRGILIRYGIKEHVCDILEGGRDAFLKREQKYGFNKL